MSTSNTLTPGEIAYDLALQVNSAEIEVNAINQREIGESLRLARERLHAYVSIPGKLDVVKLEALAEEYRLAGLLMDHTTKSLEAAKSRLASVRAKLAAHQQAQTLTR